MLGTGSLLRREGGAGSRRGAGVRSRRAEDQLRRGGRTRRIRRLGEKRPPLVSRLSRLQSLPKVPKCLS